MILVKKYEDVQEGFTFVKNYKKSIITNFYPDEVKITRWILSKIFFKIEIGESIFFVKKNKEFYSLYFISSSFDEFEISLSLLTRQNLDLIFVADVVTKDENTPILNLFKKCDFYQYTSLLRMSRMVSNPNLELENNIHLKEANLNHIDELMCLFEKYFDPIAEQLTVKSDLLNWIETECLLIYEINNKIGGFIIYDLNGLTLYLRYWFVHPDFRDQKIGSLLFNYFLYKGRNTKRQIFWVIQSNDNAIKRYKHYGFVEEKMYNFVMINKNKRYEK